MQNCVNIYFFLKNTEHLSEKAICGLAKHVFRGAHTKKSMHGKGQAVKRIKNEKTHISNEKIHFLFLCLMINCK